MRRAGRVGASATRARLSFPIVYKGRDVGDYRVDLIVEDTVVVEIKSVERLDRVFDAQLLTYLRVTGKHVGLLDQLQYARWSRTASRDSSFDSLSLYL